MPSFVRILFFFFLAVESKVALLPEPIVLFFADMNFGTGLASAAIVTLTCLAHHTWAASLVKLCPDSVAQGS